MMMASSTWWQRLVAASSCWTRSSALYSSVRWTSELNQAQSTIGHVHHGFDWGHKRALALSSSLIPKICSSSSVPLAVPSPNPEVVEGWLFAALMLSVSSTCGGGALV